MKNFLIATAFIIGAFCSPGIAQATNITLICTTPSGVVSVFAISCASAFPGYKTSSLPGITSGLCAKVISGDLGLGTCPVTGLSSINGNTTSAQTIAAGTGITVSSVSGTTTISASGGSGASLSADQTFTGANTFNNAAGVRLGAANADAFPEVVFSAAISHNAGIGSNTSDVCHTVNGALIDIANDFGPFMTIGSGQVGVCGSVYADAVVTTGFVVGTLFKDATTSATLQLGHAGAPSGACISGSIYTRSDGTTGASVYNCMTSAWVAAPSP